jgi:hypothetical protein
MPRVRTGVVSVTVWREAGSDRLIARVATVDDVLHPEPQHHNADSVSRIVELVSAWLAEFQLLPPVGDEDGANGVTLP